MIGADNHIHTKYCGHATGDVAEYAKSAAEKKMENIGFADHLPLPTGFTSPSEGITIPEEKLPSYLADVKKEAENNNGLSIATGAEADFLPGWERYTKKALKGFDYAIGSVHMIGGWNFDYTEEVFGKGLEKFADADEPYLKYYALVKKMASSGMFDVVGHIDLIKKFGYAPKKSRPEMIGDILDIAKKKGMAVELNTSGIDKKTGETYPAEEILGMCFERDIEISVGSDAHKPAEVGRHFDKAEELLRRIGYTSTTAFPNGKKRQVPI